MASVVLIGGPSGTGKSTVSELLSKTLSKSNKKCYLIEGDSWHSEANIIKMSNNIPLQDIDRWPWLEKLTQLVSEFTENYDVIIVACSMLKKIYRDFIKDKLKNNLKISNLSLFLLCNTYINVLQQMKKRENHFFKESMLKSQYDTFEKPINELNVYNIDCNNRTPVQLVDEIIKIL
ncbi:hypothetical protein C6P40_002070 [Pichia californica]|uniref:Gluconokinase n=1 Tax=Pichia californica TaxID=460514 RepID=A0A9P7BE94_9ASCO|nr:hypothetical protein C6P40_002070 [[Candida] californica]